jgi:hypothetical protein
MICALYSRFARSRPSSQVYVPPGENPRPMYFNWTAISSATDYELQVSSVSTSGPWGVYDSTVGNVIAASVPLVPGTYYSRVVPWAGSTALTATGAQEFTTT